MESEVSDVGKPRDKFQGPWLNVNQAQGNTEPPMDCITFSRKLSSS